MTTGADVSAASSKAAMRGEGQRRPAALPYTELPERTKNALANEPNRVPDIEDRLARWAHVKPRPGDAEGTTETHDGVTFTHHFAQAPGDSELLTWHYVEAGQGDVVVFLHGFPESWFMWHHQMAAAAATHRAIAIDLKGYGQSDKRTGDYRQEGVAEQLVSLLDVIGVTHATIVAHDRGAVVADYLCGAHQERVEAYVRGAQHLYHFNPELAPQERRLVDPEQALSLSDPVQTVVRLYSRATVRPVPDEHLERTIQEFAYPYVSWAVPRYFASSSFRKEWIDRRTRLLAAWSFPVLILQGRYDGRQPHEFYEGAAEYIPNADVSVRIVDGGHFFPADSPDETTKAILRFLGRNAT